MTKKLDVRDLVITGYLQESNRNFWNPLGLYMKIENGNIVIYDFREIPQGVAFCDIDQEYAENVKHEFNAKGFWRMKEFGWIIQPSSETE